MPHKHKRKREEDDSNFNLPPTSRARTLSVHQKSESIFTSDADRKRTQEARRGKKKNSKSKSNGAADFEDDTPKAFKRLMAFQPGAGGKKMRPSGLDDGDLSKKKKRKQQREREDRVVPNSESASKPDPLGGDAGASTEASDTTTTQLPRLLPGESLSSYSARVDQSLPLTSIPRHRTRLTSIPGLEKIKTPLTKHNKRLARMQKEWRATDARLREKKQEEHEEMLEKKEEDEILWLGAGIDPTLSTNSNNNNNKKKKKKRKGGDGMDDADPWKILEKKRREEGQLGRQANLQDVVAAPPTLKPVKNIFKEKPQLQRKSGTVSVV
ncbi:uncharacterized protein Z520_00820 [Fonsecaea multimorphosa CBS 102226]|uniref:Uncharacterized protein n=1 Tax=Fonsecaea multimorphosa CBS 102226 TaxID=1442371 RepID=A0A0D2KDC7_9EURO|nr:uncharacterized protein Z520_00820 [Fonsecaea multimorphosa CBS 102226]KIY04128.1 hypothetical protein Z520_00820 [Fonsecaea multimorphosa CBS 102226]OAL31959.1 hypothetical protein AYO22_00829 [Fonsecaea multimorphosa]